VNNTYLDCPIKNFTNHTKLSFVTAIFNPGTHLVNHTKLAVPHGNWTVEVFNAHTHKFEKANATVLCDMEITEYESCWLYTENTVYGHEISFMQISYNASNDLKAKVPHKADKIENNQQYLHFKGLDQEFGSLFVVQKKPYMNSYKLGFDLRYYQSY
jgi:hypothetical protein